MEVIAAQPACHIYDFADEVEEVGHCLGRYGAGGQSGRIDPANRDLRRAIAFVGPACVAKDAHMRPAAPAPKMRMLKSANVADQFLKQANGASIGRGTVRIGEDGLTIFQLNKGQIDNTRITNLHGKNAPINGQGVGKNAHLAAGADIGPEVVING